MRKGKRYLITTCSNSTLNITASVVSGTMSFDHGSLPFPRRLKSQKSRTLFFNEPLEWGIFGFVKQGSLRIDQEKVGSSLLDFQAILAQIKKQQVALHPQLQGLTMLQLSRAKGIFNRIAPGVFGRRTRPHLTARKGANSEQAVASWPWKKWTTNTPDPSTENPFIWLFS